MKPLAFAYHALRSAGRWVRFGLLTPLLPLVWIVWPIGFEWSYSAAMGSIAWQSARRAMGWEVRC